MSEPLPRSSEFGVCSGSCFAPNSYFRTPSVIVMMFLVLFLPMLPVPSLYAGDSPLSSVLGTAKALVDVQSVNTTVMSGKSQGFFDEVTGQLFVTKKVRPLSYTRNGSGVIIDPRGIIVTNAHTIRGAGGLGVTLFDGTHATVKEASLVPGTDLAFLFRPPRLLLGGRLKRS